MINYNTYTNRIDKADHYAVKTIASRESSKNGGENYFTRLQSACQALKRLIRRFCLENS